MRSKMLLRREALGTVLALAMLGSVAAAAGDPPGVEVSIEVEAAPRSISITSNSTPSFEVTAFRENLIAGAPGGQEVYTGISFANPEGNGDARILVDRDANDLGGLQIFATMTGPTERPYEIAQAANWTAEESEEKEIARKISATDEFSASVRWTLGTAASKDAGSPRTVNTTFTFTIVDDVIED